MNPVDIARVTASSIKQLLTCAWAYTPMAPLELVQEETLPMREGSAVHLANERAILGEPVEMGDILRKYKIVGAKGKPKVAAKHMQHMLWWANFRRAYAVRELGAERAYGWDPTTDTVHHIGDRIERAYGDYAKTCICGTSDVTVVTESGEVIVIDWKTGKSEYAVNEGQIVFLAMCAAADTGAESVKYYTVCASETETITYAHLVTRGDMAALKAELKRVLARGAPGQVTGDHCRMCKAKSVCASYQRPIWPIRKTGT